MPGMCLTLVAGLVSLVFAWPQDQAPSLALRAPEIPLAAVAATPALRAEKRAQTHRLAFPEREHGARLVSDRHTPGPQPRSLAQQANRNLPRRLLPAGHLLSRPPDDSSDPLLS